MISVQRMVNFHRCVNIPKGIFTISPSYPIYVPIIYPSYFLEKSLCVIFLLVIMHLYNGIPNISILNTICFFNIAMDNGSFIDDDLV